LGGIWTHVGQVFPFKQTGFYHDGRFATLLDVVNHYNGVMNLGLTESEKTDLVEYLKSLPTDEGGGMARRRPPAKSKPVRLGGGPKRVPLKPKPRRP
jgi:hypothetical protein